MAAYSAAVGQRASNWSTAETVGVRVGVAVAARVGVLVTVRVAVPVAVRVGGAVCVRVGAPEGSGEAVLTGGAVTSATFDAVALAAMVAAGTGVLVLIRVATVGTSVDIGEHAATPKHTRLMHRQQSVRIMLTQ
jgi:hypothetical protein